MRSPFKLPYTPYDPFNFNPFKELMELLENNKATDWSFFRHKVDGNTHTYELDLPGIKKDKVKASLEKNRIITVTWERDGNKGSTTVTTPFEERSIDSYDASLEDGVLTLTFKIKEESQGLTLTVK